MKTYVLEIDGVPSIAFRAKCDEDASEFTDRRKWFYLDEDAQPLTVRLATLPEQAKWRAASVQGSFDVEEEEDEEAAREYNPDGPLVSLG